LTSSEYDTLVIEERFKETYMAIRFSVLAVFCAVSSQKNKFVRSWVVLLVNRSDPVFMRSAFVDPAIPCEEAVEQESISRP
jgi:hypothetical protein